MQITSNFRLFNHLFCDKSNMKNYRTSGLNIQENAVRSIDLAVFLFNTHLKISFFKIPFNLIGNEKGNSDYKINNV